jgi:hypothetical protein
MTALLPDETILVREDVEAGPLRIVLPDVVLEKVPVHALHAFGRLVPVRVRRFIDFVAQTLAGWEEREPARPQPSCPGAGTVHSVCHLSHLTLMNPSWWNGAMDDGVDMGVVSWLARVTDRMRARRSDRRDPCTGCAPSPADRGETA